MRDLNKFPSPMATKNSALSLNSKQQKSPYVPQTFMAEGHQTKQNLQFNNE